MKLVIGVTTSRSGGWRSFLLHRLAVWRAGGKAVRLVSGEALPPLASLTGLVIGGGDDIGAELYQGEVLPDVRVDPERDQLEVTLLRRALPAGIPTLGICRGAQMINIALGGTLHGDIYRAYANSSRMRTVLPRKRIIVEKGSRLDHILGCNPCHVNALHHQAVDRLGEGLHIVGRDEHGVVQAIESAKHRFLIGVQWHPEFLFFSASQQRLFRALLDAARERMEATAPMETPAAETFQANAGT